MKGISDFFLLIAAIGALELASPNAGNADSGACIAPTLRGIVGQFFPYDDLRYRLAGKGNERTPLGQGMGGAAELVRSPPHQPLAYRVEKVYKHRKDMLTDLRSLETMNAIAERSKDFGFSVVKCRIIDDLDLKTATRFVPGRTLHDLMVDPKISNDLKQRLAALYKANLGKMEASLRENSQGLFQHAEFEPFYFASGKNDQLPLLEGELVHPAGTTEYLIKSDNVIVDPTTLQMTIIDPM